MVQLITRCIEKPTQTVTCCITLPSNSEQNYYKHINDSYRKILLTVVRNAIVGQPEDISTYQAVLPYLKETTDRISGTQPDRIMAITSKTFFRINKK